MLRRACRLPMEFATAKKRHEIGRLLEAYRGAVNFYVRSLWQSPGALDKGTLARLSAERTSHAAGMSSSGNAVKLAPTDR